MSLCQEIFYYLQKKKELIDNFHLDGGFINAISDEGRRLFGQPLCIPISLDVLRNKFQMGFSNLGIYEIHISIHYR